MRLLIVEHERRIAELIQGALTLQRFPVKLIHSVVMRGLDPRIHHIRKSMWKWTDPRVKPAGDGDGRTSVDSNRPGTAVVSLMWRLGRVVPKQILGEKLYGLDERGSNTIPDHLRRKLLDAGATAEIHTIRGVRYLLTEGSS
jgi:DNA-binding response OmpR family regulator